MAELTLNKLLLCHSSSVKWEKYYTLFSPFFPIARGFPLSITQGFRGEDDVRGSEQLLINTVLFVFAVGSSVFHNEPCLQPRATWGSLRQP